MVARDPYVLHTVAKVLLQEPELEWGLPLEVLVADDCFGMSTISSTRTADVLSRAVTDTLGSRLIIAALYCMLMSQNVGSFWKSGFRFDNHNVMY